MILFFAYQELTTTGKSDPSKLLEIRGSIFINPLTSILYYDYLGLYFLRRAVYILTGQKNPPLLEMIKSIENCAEEKKSMALVYCKASESFKRAEENIGNDMIWTGYEKQIKQDIKRKR